MWNGCVGWAHPAVLKREQGPEAGHVLSKLDVSITLRTGLVSADRNGTRTKKHLCFFGYQLRREIVVLRNLI